MNEAVTDDAAFHQKLRFEIRRSNLVADRKYMFKLYPSCFVGSEFVSWLEEKYQIPPGVAVDIGKSMLKKRIFHHVTGDHDFENEYLFYRLREDEANHRVLNDHESSISSCNNPLTTSGQLLCLLLSLSRFHKGNTMEIKISPEFHEFLQLSTSLLFVSLGELPENHKMPFWINIFNTLALHSTITSGPPTESARKQNRFFGYHQYNVGNDLWSLIDIYQGVLRCNRPLRNQNPLMEDTDRRILHICTELDPRVHFLVNFQAVSCPKIPVLTAGNNIDEMNYAVRTYLQNEVRFVPQTYEVVLPAVMKRYRRDFKGNDRELLTWLAQFLEEEDAVKAQKLIARKAGPKLKYQPFDWSPQDLTTIKLSRTSQNSLE